LSWILLYIIIGLHALSLVPQKGLIQFCANSADFPTNPLLCPSRRKGAISVA